MREMHQAPSVRQKASWRNWAIRAGIGLVWTAAIGLGAIALLRHAGQLAAWFDEPELARILAQLKTAAIRLPVLLTNLIWIVLTAWTVFLFRLPKRAGRIVLAVLVSIGLTLTGLGASLVLARVHDIPVLTAARAFRVLLPALTGSGEVPSGLFDSEPAEPAPPRLIAATASYGPGWLAGFAQVPIAVDLSDGGPYYIAGYRNGYEASGILDPQQVHAICLDDQSGQGGVLLLSVDCIGLTSADVAVIRTRLAPIAHAFGLRAVHVLSSHTHAGVDTLGLWGPVGVGGKNETFMEALVQAAREAGEEACQAVQPGQLTWGETEISDLQQDSRLPHVFDPTLTVLRFIPDSGDPGFRLVNFAAHPEALRSQNTRISADYPAYLAEGIRKASGDRLFFAPGAIGGLISTRRLQDAQGITTPVEENVVQTGQLLAEAALSIRDEQMLPASLYTSSAAVRIDLENPIFIALRFLGAISTQAVKGNGPFGLAVETQVSLLAFGDRQILLVPGELFPELVTGDPFAGASPENKNPEPLAGLLGSEPLVFGLCDDEIGYIVPPNDFLLHASRPYTMEAIDRFGRDHYEETNSVGQTAAAAIARAVDLLSGEYKRLNGGN